ncbi:MAG: hypothetical protein R6X35_16095 [Candidatus Krumholzibacteriia bacterium]
MRWKIGGAAVVVVVLAVLVAALALRASIAGSRDEIVALAREADPTAADAVTAVMAWVADGSRPVADRNRGVWALGQLRDARALPLLRGYLVASCRHGEDICQHELRKAIDLCAGGGPDLLRVGATAGD